MMNRWKKRPVAFVVLSFLLLTFCVSPALAQSDEADSEITAASMVGDLFVLRPLGLAATVLGTAFFLISLPFTAASGDADLAAQKLVKEPGKFTLDRPLGKLP